MRACLSSIGSGTSASRTWPCLESALPNSRYYFKKIDGSNKYILLSFNESMKNLANLSSADTDDGHPLNMASKKLIRFENLEKRIKAADLSAKYLKIASFVALIAAAAFGLSVVTGLIAGSLLFTFSGISFLGLTHFLCNKFANGFELEMSSLRSEQNELAIESDERSFYEAQAKLARPVQEYEMMRTLADGRALTRERLNSYKSQILKAQLLVEEVATVRTQCSKIDAILQAGVELPLDNVLNDCLAQTLQFFAEEANL